MFNPYFMKQSTVDSFSKFQDAYSSLVFLVDFCKSVSHDDSLPKNLRLAFENAEYEFYDHFAVLDMFMRYLISADPDLVPRQYKEF